MSSPSLEEVLARYNPRELESRWQDLARAVRDSSPRRHGRELDPLPYLLDESAWQQIEPGLLQRARLLNQLLEDAYGEQALLKERRLAPALYFDNPLWVQPCLGQLNSELSRLLLYAADLVCDESGRWWVLRDLTQNPAGFGLLLENRRWMARAYQEVFAAHEVRPIAPTFQGLRESLGELRQQAGGPRVVMLTPPASSRHSTDDLALAQFLGCPLVEGEDLTVRRDTLYLKLLEGLQPLEVVLRRIPDRDCDPLEMPTALGRGVAGLLQVVRQGNLAVTNSVGSGWLESPALGPKLDELSVLLTGQTLRLPSLGEAPEGEPAVYRHWSGGRPLLPPEQPGGDGRWFAQRFAATDQVLRCFVLYTPQGYQVVPGGMLRLPSRTTRDVWRWACHPTHPLHSARPEPVPIEVHLSRAGGDVPSRVAEQFYWFGRYLERTESLLRLARQLLHRQVLQGPDGCWKPLLESRPELAGDLTRWTHGHGDDQLQSLLGHVHRLGEALRDRASADLPRALAALPLLDQPLSGGRLLGYLEDLCVPIWALVAITRESLFRGHGFRFLEIGRRLERALQIVELLALPGGEDPDWEMLDLLLDAADSGRTFRRRYPAGLHWSGVRDLLLRDETHPRSLAFQLRSLDELFQHLPHPQRHRKNVHRVMEALQSEGCEDLKSALSELSRALGSAYFTHIQPRALGVA